MATFQTIDVSQEHRIAAPLDTVFTMLTTRIGEWWREPYRLGGDESEIRFDPSPGGALSEHWGDGEFAVWGTVTRYQPNRIVAFAGACGMNGGVNGEFSFAVEPDGEGTVLRLVHIASGLIDDSTRTGYDRGWTELFGWLREIAEREAAAATLTR